jgi:hypothetical protein
MAWSFPSTCFLFLILSKRDTMIASSIASTATPAPIPAFAPVLSPLLSVSDDSPEPAVGAEATFVGVLPVGEALTVGEVLAVVNALGAADIDVDDGNATPTVAASAKILELIPQQFLSPQHQVPCPHFRTGAFSFCHYIPFVRPISTCLSHFRKKLTLAKLHTSFKHSALSHVGSVQPCLHHNFSPPFVPSNASKF